MRVDLGQVGEAHEAHRPAGPRHVGKRRRSGRPPGPEADEYEDVRLRHRDPRVRAGRSVVARRRRRRTVRTRSVAGTSRWVRVPHGTVLGVPGHNPRRLRSGGPVVGRSVAIVAVVTSTLAIWVWEAGALLWL